MCTFIGDFQCKADAKCRLVLPSAFKHSLEADGEPARLVIRKDIFEKCLLLTPYSEWQRQMTDLRGRINVYNRQHTQFLREMQRNAVEVQMDNFGRILIPKRLLTMIDADKEITLLGVDKHIELWDTQTLESQAMTSEDLGALAEKILGGAQ